MSARMHRRSAAIALTVAITAGAAALLSACGPNATGSNNAAPAGNTVVTTTPSATATPTAAPTASVAPSTAPSTTPGSAAPVTATPRPASLHSAPAAAPGRNGTAKNGLTISNGTRYVLMNGTSVDFGTAVKDLAWSPNGAKAAFIDGAGDLVTANPDGSGRVVVAKNSGGQTWSHPTWQVAPADSHYLIPAKNNLVFSVGRGGAARLEKVPADSVDAQPTVLTLGGYAGDNVAPLPETGNGWASGGGKIARIVYANSTDGNVYIRDEYLRQNGGVLTPGSEPALSPSGSEVVFVRSVGGHDHLFAEQLDNGPVPAKDLTPHATTDYTEPAWSPDGTTLAVRTPDGIATLPANGSAAPTLVSTFPGLPSYR
ncbi:hypothetical protein [Kitasatospora sp. MAP5-34]|uniref:hypothetical protein n=1 Tax=Kitasatospora sp. MAP5-34 TaxID=3035102 RepID=UPI00247613B3|nr:hypothetical protein [Kitasatospora sp. MAP5-34]MDH6576478.1 hypothetical protein [Kitasatospora sp. MAP5-34]